jgi:asparagine synthase (glutamine-hydrolysing)
MCGICGALGVTVPLDSMSECQTHRGPEAVGTYRDDGAQLANQRLRIIDVEGGDQPIYNEDGDVVVVYNGEIYNFQSLRSRLREAGHTFTTASDTEVLTHGYEQWGADVFERLNGMFAAAIYDTTEQRLLLGRDRAGIKPLHYAQTAEGIVFASEPKAILQSEIVDPAVDTDALRYFLQLRYSPSETTLFEGIEKVQPGTYLDCYLGNDGVEVEQNTFWSLSNTPSNPPANPSEALRSTLRQAVKRQLVSEVPIGFYLSGGLDTSSVVGLASELRDEPIHTFCMGFADSEWDERESARMVANHFDTIHHELTIDGEFMQDFPEMIWHADEPKRNLYPYYVSQEMANHVTVALGGLGADELFGGYIYRYLRLQHLEQLRTQQAEWVRETVTDNARTVLQNRLRDGQIENDGELEEVSVLSHLDDGARLYVLLNSTDVITDIESYESRVFGDELQDGSIPAERIRSRWTPEEAEKLCERALRWDFTVKLPNDFLFVEDRMSMAHSLESRVPFLDNELVDLAFSLPFSEKVGQTSQNSNGPTHGKRVLREAMDDLLPQTVFERDKQGFTMPTYQFVETELLTYARSILDNPHIVREGLIDGGYLENLLERSPSRDLIPHYKFLWKLVALEIWYQTYICGESIGPKSIDSYAT